MNGRNRHTYCGQCGNPMQPGDQFCGSCGAVMLPPAPQAEKVVPEPAPTSRSTPYAPRRRKRFWVNAAAISLLLLISVGAVAALALNSGRNPLGESDPRPAGDLGNEPSSNEGTESTASISPDPAFDKLLPTLPQRTDAQIMLPAELPDELKNFGIDENLKGDRYGIVFLNTPTEDLVGGWPRSQIRGSLEAVPASEYESNQLFEATSTEDVKLPDGTEAKLRHMQTVQREVMYGSRWEGTFDKGGYTYTLSILKGQDAYVVTKQALSSMVVLDELAIAQKESDDYGTTESTTPETTTPSSTQPNPAEETAIIKAIQGYYAALEENDFDEAYSYIVPTARNLEDRDTFADRYQSYEIQGNQIYYLDVKEVSEDTATARVEIGYEFKDGRKSRFNDTWQLVREGEDWKLNEASSEELEARSPESTMPESTEADDLAAEAEEAAGDYYRASGSQDWDYTYDALDSETQALFTREEWLQKNQWFADQGETIYDIESAELDETAQEPLAEVAVRLTGEDGSSSIRTTYFVNENGEWKHRFGQEEIDLFGPGVPYEEWVDE